MDSKFIKLNVSMNAVYKALKDDIQLGRMVDYIDNWEKFWRFL